MKRASLCMMLAVFALAGGCRGGDQDAAPAASTPPVAVTGLNVAQFDVVDPATGMLLATLQAGGPGGSFTISVAPRPAEVAPDFPFPVAGTAEPMPTPVPQRDACCLYFVGVAAWGGSAVDFDFVADVTRSALQVPATGAAEASFNIANASAE